MSDQECTAGRPICEPRSRTTPGTSDISENGGEIALRGDQAANTGYPLVDTDDQTLGADWTTTYGGAGTMVGWDGPGQVAWRNAKVEHRELHFYDGTPPDENGHTRGAILRPGTVCERCRRTFDAGHIADITFGPNMSGTFTHRDCDDPPLAKAAE